MKQKSPIALLVGFHYPSTEGIQPIPGILVDLYRMARYCAIQKMDYYVFTDYRTNPTIDEMLPSMIQGHVDSGVDTWLEFIKKNNKYCYIDKESQLWAEMSSKISPLNHILFYFTGHGTKGTIVLPSNEKISIHWLSYLFTQKMDIYSQLFFIIDCCEAFFHNQWKYNFSTQTKKLNTHDSIKSTHHVYCVCSTHEMPGTSANGSKFSRDIIDGFTSKKRNWTHYESMFVLSSYPPTRCIPSWVLGEDSFKVYPFWIQVVL